METIFKEKGGEKAFPPHFSEFLNASHFSPTVWGAQRLWSRGWAAEAAVASTKLAGASLERWRMGGGAAGSAHPRGRNRRSPELHAVSPSAVLRGRGEGIVTHISLKASGVPVSHWSAVTQELKRSPLPGNSVPTPCPVNLLCPQSQSGLRTLRLSETSQKHPHRPGH